MKIFGGLPRNGRTTAIIVSALVVLALGAAAWIKFRPQEADSGARPSGEPGGESQKPDEADLERRIVAFCGDCHGMPSPGGFPQVAWYEETKQGFDFYTDSLRTDLDPPPLERVASWFRKRAPVAIAVPRPPAEPERGSPRFVAVDPNPAIANAPKASLSQLKWTRLSGNSPWGFVLCDMRSGKIHWRESGERGDLRMLAEVSNPAHVEVADLDEDGTDELIVADLGSFQPEDHDRGSVAIFHRTKDGAYGKTIVLPQIGRVADVRPGDFDGDGKPDLIVAEFGWRKTGKIHLLTNRGTGTAFEFEDRIIDKRHGTIHVPTADLNGDGKLDFIALISQEHETVEAFLNMGEGEFRRETIFAANEPAFGSSGIELVDLDGDGDLDVLYTAGDTFDSFYLKPYHGIRWLENRGKYPFTVHELGAMPGVHRALAGDFDGDGDLDIAACALLPSRILGKQSEDDFDSLIWLEQTEPRQFVRHSLKTGTCRHAAMELADFDEDGDLDIALGYFNEQQPLPVMTIWRNQSRTAEK